MLRKLAEKSKKIFFEPPGYKSRDRTNEIIIRKGISDKLVSQNKSVPEYYTSLLESILGEREKYQIKYLGNTEYRNDPILLVECKKYC